MKKIFDYPKLLFAVVVAMQTAFLINSRALWFSDEIRYANAYSNLVNFGKWVVLYLNGTPYPDKPPVYFWLVYIVQSLSRLDIPSAMYLTSAITGFMYLLAHYYFSMTVTNDKKLSVVSGLILLTNFYFIGLMNYVRMDLLFCVFIIFSFTLMYKFLEEGKARYVYLAYLVAAFGALTKGPIALIFPFLFYIVAAVAMGKYKKLLNIHFYLGVFVTLIPVAGWILAIYVNEGYDFLYHLLYTQIYKRAVHTWHHAEPFYYYAYTLPLAWLPWVLIFFTSGFGNLKSMTKEFLSSGNGQKFVIISIITGFLFLSMLSGKITIYALPIYSPIAIYIGYLYINSDRRVIFWRSVSVLMLVLAGVFYFVNDIPEVPVKLDGNVASAFAALALSIFTWFIAKGDKVKALASFVVAMAIFFNVFGLTMAKSVDHVMSPKEQGTLMSKYILDGYKPVAYRVYSGLYSYYADADILEISGPNYPTLTKVVTENDKVVLGIAEKYWKRWENRPENLQIINRQWIAGREYFLVLNR